MISFSVRSLKILNGSHLKLLAVVTMILDHIAYYLQDCVEWIKDDFCGGISYYAIFRTLGRMAFPIFAFLICEGFKYTKNRITYGINLFIFAVLSEIPWNLAHSDSLCYGKQNVYFTLFFGYIILICIDRYKNEKIRQTVFLLLILLIALFLNADYGLMGIGMILLIHILRENKLYLTIIITCILPYGWRYGLAFIPVLMYNGERGFIRGRSLKYAFYLFYPLHLLFFWILKYCIYL